MRKYDKKNKRNIGIIIAISVLIIIMFSLVIRLFLSIDKKEYQVIPGTLVFDKDKTIVKVESKATIKMKWNKEYYLKYNDKDIELGTSAISYNEDTGELHLYGRYYEIGAGDEINITSDETIIKSTALTKFYKLADRKYLVVDKEIKSADGLLSTTDFLMVDLDKVGNATLTNHKVNLKTFSETTIVTSNYTFDIANEILTYGSDKIDLKKIIGSSNTYTKEDLVPEENTNGTSNNGITNITENNNNGNGNGNNNLQEVIKELDKQKPSIISVTSTVNKITVDYVIYDPKEEYISFYMEVKKEGSSEVDTVYLNSSATTYELTNGIFPNTNYELTFKYSEPDKDNNISITTLDKVNITTKKPNISLEVTRISFNEIYYLVTTDNSYPLTSATLTVLVNGEEPSSSKINGEISSSSEISINGNTTGNVSISNISEKDIIELKLTDVKSNGTIIKDLNSSYKFKY
ncbi:MAG: hypothetical protein ACI4VL_05275 [Bacilli bacterium]